MNGMQQQHQLHNSSRRPNSLAATPKELKYHNQVTHSSALGTSSQQHQIPINVAILMNNNITVQQQSSQRGALQQQQQQQQQQHHYQTSESMNVQKRKEYSNEAPYAGLVNNHHHYQQSHSLGRDLQGMGLITQVKKGETVPVAYPSGIPLNHMHLSRKQDLQENRSNASFNEYGQQSLLKPQRSDVKGRKTLVLDLDETLVHSSFKPPTGREPPADIVLPVDIEGRVCNVYVVVRPGCQQFLAEMAKIYEVVIFTASLSKYADPLMDIIDQQNVAPQRLFREHCTFSEQLGVFVKDMARLGRNLKDSIIIDNSPLSFAFQPENGMPILSWYDDRSDTKLLELIPVLQYLTQVPDVRPVLRASCSKDNVYMNEKSITMCKQYMLEQQQAIQQIKMSQRQSPMKARSPLKQSSESYIDQSPPKVNNWVSMRGSAENTNPSQRTSNRNNYQNESLHQNSMGKTQDVQLFSKIAAQTIDESKDSSIQRHNTTLQVYETIQAAVENQSYRLQQQQKQIARSQAVQKKRPQTAHRDNSSASSPSRLGNKGSTSANVSLNNIAANSPITLASKRAVNTQAPSPNIQTVKVKKTEVLQVPKPKKAIGIPMPNGFRPLTSQNSTRNSQERIIGSAGGNLISASLAAAQNQTTSSLNLKSKSRASSARKNQQQTSVKANKPQTFSERDLLMISSPHSPSASKNLSKLISSVAASPMMASQSPPQLSSPPAAPSFISSSSQSVKQQQVRASSTKHSSIVDTPPTKQQNSLINKLAVTPQTGVKASAPPKSASKRQVSRSPASNSKDDGVTGGRNPGKIFTSAGNNNNSSTQKVDQQRQNKLREQALSDYSNLMKNLTPHFNSTKTSSHHNSRSTSKNQHNSTALIKGSKLNNIMVLNQTVNFSASKQNNTSGGKGSGPFNQSTFLKQALLQLDQNKEALASLGSNSQMLALEIAQTQSSTASKEAQQVPSSSLQDMSSMLNEFEQTQKFNKEKLLMRNIGSPKQPNAAPGVASSSHQKNR